MKATLEKALRPLLLVLTALVILACGPQFEPEKDNMTQRFDQDSARFYEAPDHVYAAMGGAMNAARDVNLGFETIIKPPLMAGGNQSLAQLVNSPGPEVMVLNVNLEEALGPDRYASSGSLVLSLSAEVVEYGDTPVSVFLMPLVAKIQLGTGGVMIEYEVDALRAVVPVHSPSVRVLVYYQALQSTLASSAWVSGAESKALPASVRVKATIQRSVSKGNATRTFYVDNKNGPWKIPKFSSCFQILSGEALVDVEANNGQLFQLSDVKTGGGFTLDSILEAPNFARFVKNACCRPTVPGADYIQLAGTNNRRLTLVHSIDL